MTAAYQLAKGGAEVEVFESSGAVGGMCRSLQLWDQTVDVGPHRFFSSDARVNRLWLEVAEHDYRMVDRPDVGDAQADPETRAAQEKVPDVTFYGPYVDFDGARTLAAVEAFPKDQSIGEEFLAEHCPCVLTAVDRICDWATMAP